MVRGLCHFPSFVDTKILFNWRTLKGNSLLTNPLRKTLMIDEIRLRLLVRSILSLRSLSSHEEVKYKIVVRLGFFPQYVTMNETLWNPSEWTRSPSLSNFLGPFHTGSRKKHRDNQFIFFDILKFSHDGKGRDISTVRVSGAVITGSFKKKPLSLHQPPPPPSVNIYHF